MTEFLQNIVIFIQRSVRPPKRMFSNEYTDQRQCLHIARHFEYESSVQYLPVLRRPSWLFEQDSVEQENFVLRPVVDEAFEKKETKL